MKLKGSSLIFSFIVLSFLLISALSVAAVSVTSRRSSLATKNSNVSFQVADSVVEVMLAQIYKDNNTITDPTVLAGKMAMATGLSTSCNIGKKQIEGKIGAGDYVAVLLTKAGDIISCTDATWRGNVAKIKFLGTYQSTTRAIEVAITPKNDSIAWWKFDDGSGSSTAIDSSGNSNIGTLVSSPSWVTGEAGTGWALRFDGSNYVSMANESNFDFDKGDNFSGCAWINTTKTNPVSQTIISKLDNSSNMGWEFGLSHPGSQPPKSDHLEFYLTNTNQTNSIDVESTTTLSQDFWYYVCFTYNGSSSASGVNFYLNGNPEPISSVVRDNLSSSTLNNKSLQVGARDGDNLPFNGSIDDVRVYNRTLSPTEMMDLFNSF